MTGLFRMSILNFSQYENFTIRTDGPDKNEEGVQNTRQLSVFRGYLCQIGKDRVFILTNGQLINLLHDVLG